MKLQVENLWFKVLNDSSVYEKMVADAAFCVCKQGISPGIMQKAIDYACGAGADYNPIRPNGQCYNPNSIATHCSYAVNSYFQRNAAKGATCDFNGAAMLTNADPSMLFLLHSSHSRFLQYNC